MKQEERQRLEAQVRQELEQEHKQRVEREAEREARRKQAGEVSADVERLRVERELRADFYREKGYLEYINSRGESEWLLPEEHDRRMKARKRRKRKKGRPADADGPNFSPLQWLGLAGAAMAAGWLLLKVVLS